MKKCNESTSGDKRKFSEPHKVFPPKPGPIEDPDTAYQKYRDQQREDALKWTGNKKKPQ